MTGVAALRTEYAMRVLRALVVGLFLLNASAASAGAIVSGLAAAGHGERCAAFPAGAVAAGDAVTLVGAEPEPWSAVVTVQRELETCAVLDDAMIGDAAIPGPYYELSAAPAGVDPDSWVAIAVPGRPPLHRSESGFTAELDGRAPREHFHICASYEGLHLTIWSGLPYKGQRRAHAYFYLGYDVDPTCPDVLADGERERLKKE